MIYLFSSLWSQDLREPIWPQQSRLLPARPSVSLLHAFATHLAAHTALSSVSIPQGFATTQHQELAIIFLPGANKEVDQAETFLLRKHLDMRVLLPGGSCRSWVSGDCPDLSLPRGQLPQSPRASPAGPAHRRLDAAGSSPPGRVKVGLVGGKAHPQECVPWDWLLPGHS